MSTSLRDNSKKYPVIVTAAVIRDGERVLIARRESGHLAGKWEFPGGKLEPGESPEQCLAREIREELGIEVCVGDIFAVVYHEYEFGPILLLAYECKLAGKNALPQGDGVRWVSREDLEEFDFAPADLPIMRKVRQLLEENK
jgi:8-oxo-dGTP diphosphatase